MTDDARTPEPDPTGPREPRRLLSFQLSPPTFTHTRWRFRRQSATRRWE